MTAKTINVSPPNAFVCIEDADGEQVPDVPTFVPSALITSTESMVVVFCQVEQDGAIEFTLGPMREVAGGSNMIR